MDLPQMCRGYLLVCLDIGSTPEVPLDFPPWRVRAESPFDFVPPIQERAASRETEAERKGVRYRQRFPHGLTSRTWPSTAGCVAWSRENIKAARPSQPSLDEVNPMPCRRDFLAALAALPFVGEKRVPVVDTHLHCFAGRDDKRFPYHKDAPYRPEKPATPQDLLKAMTDGGVDYAVVVHPEPYQDDHSYLEYCLKQDPKRLKGTCLLFAQKDDAPAKLRELAKRCAVVAVRVHAYAPERQPPFGKPALKALWKQAADLGLAVQLHFEPRYAAGFEPYIKEFAKTTVIVDHLGRPFQGTPE